MSVFSRVVAVFIAIGLVVGAFMVREDRVVDVMPGVPGDGGPPYAAGCPTELDELCRSIAGADAVAWSAAAAADLAERLTTGDGPPALLPSAWADLVDAGRQRAGQPPLARSDVLASSPVLLVGFEQRVTTLATACGVEPGAVGWGCIGEHAGRAWTSIDGPATWGDVRAGHLPPDSASGLVATAGVVAARVGPTFSLRDLQDVGFATWFRTVERAVQPLPAGRRSYLEAMRVTGPPAANVASVLEAEVAGADLTAGPRQLVVSVPEPLYAVELVVVGDDAGAVRDVSDAVDRAALAAAGWRVDGQAPPGAPVPDLPPATPSPDGGVLTAVRTTWEQVAG